ncbi:MAG: 23S rRNA pseudouridine1911/1915/1917 synthase [Candidatus Paceibacteria bacterium]
MSNTNTKSNPNNLQVLFEDNHLIAINKRSGDITQGDKTGDTPLSDIVKAYIKVKYNKPGDVFLGTIHRLDRPVSGVILFAKTSKALTRMTVAFKDKTPQKTYWAVVEQEPKETKKTLIQYLQKNSKTNKSIAFTYERSDAKRCELDYILKGKSDRYYYLEVNPKTGRHHQIRVQLSTNGMIIKGDLKYGAKRPNKDGSIHLHAKKLRFEHPVTKETMTVTAPTPKEVLWQDFETIMR